jgi:hypothetical protein
MKPVSLSASARYASRCRRLPFVKPSSFLLALAQLTEISDRGETALGRLEDPVRLHEVSWREG